MPLFRFFPCNFLSSSHLRWSRMKGSLTSSLISSCSSFFLIPVSLIYLVLCVFFFFSSDLSVGFSHATSSPLRLGAGQNEGPPRFFFHGFMQDIAYFPRALDRETIMTHNHLMNCMMIKGRRIDRKDLEEHDEGAEDVGCNAI